MTDEQRALLTSLLPWWQRGRPRRWTLRQLDGIWFGTGSALRGRDVPERHGTWRSIYELFRRWQLPAVDRGPRAVVGVGHQMA